MASGAVAVTVIEPAPVMEGATVSVAVTVCVPAVSRVILKFPSPLFSGAFAGKMAFLSELVICTVPV
jgi:hypothetical protein